MSDVDTSNEQCALVCMIVSNPGDGERPHAWQKRVNDLIRALRDERNELQQIFDLQWTRMQEATRYWQIETGQHDVRPDLGKMLEWFMQEKRRGLAKAIDWCENRPIATSWSVSEMRGALLDVAKRNV